MTNDEMVGWHHRLNGHESEQTPGMLQSMGSSRVRHSLVTEHRQQNEHNGINLKTVSKNKTEVINQLPTKSPPDPESFLESFS